MGTQPTGDSVARYSNRHCYNNVSAHIEVDHKPNPNAHAPWKSPILFALSKLHAYISRTRQ